jgi:hypothetical protein
MDLMAYSLSFSDTVIAGVVLYTKVQEEESEMSRKQELIYLPMVGTILLCLLVGVYLAASKRFSKPGPSKTIVKHKVNTSSEDALKYWTENRMRDAKAAPLPHVSTLDREKKDPRRPPRASRSRDSC